MKNFTVNCHINTKTEEKAIEIAKKCLEIGRGKEHDEDIGCSSLANGVFCYGNKTIYFNKWVLEGSYNCGDNEELFLALAALNDSDDYMQHFYAVEDGVPRLCKSKHFEEEFAMAELYHKMSAKELIDYFKTKNE